MSNKILIEHIGNYPKIQQESPNRTHDFLDDHPSNEPHDIEYHCYAGRGAPPNIYAALEAISQFHELGLYPPKWALDDLVVGINRHLKNPDPELFAKQMGISGQASGATRPRVSFDYAIESWDILGDAMILSGAFGLSFSDTARALVEKYELEITPKRLMNRIRERFPDFSKTTKEMFARGDYDPFEFNESPAAARKGFIATYPRFARNIIENTIGKHAKT